MDSSQSDLQPCRSLNQTTIMTSPNIIRTKKRKPLMDPQPGTSLSLNEATNLQGPTTSAKKRTTNATKSLASAKRKLSFNQSVEKNPKKAKQEYQASGVKSTLHGIVYQLMLLTEIIVIKLN